MKVNRNIIKQNKLERKDYNLVWHYKEWQPKEFKYDEIECYHCGIVSSDDSWKKGKEWLWIKDLKWFECSQCEKVFCSRCVIDVEFENNLIRDDKDIDKDGSGLKFVEPFIDKGKVCYDCLEHMVDRVDLWRVLHSNNIVVKDEKVLEQEENNDKWYNF